MPERIRETAEFDPRAIAKAMNDWLQAEIESSMEGRNAILDDWEQFQRDLRLPFDDPHNQNAGKTKSHYNRLLQWTLASEQYPDLLQDDYYLARQMFCAQMFVSGAYRRQCFLQAHDADDYALRRRSMGPVGINLQDTVAQRLSDYSSGDPFLTLPYKNTPEAHLTEETMQTNDGGLQISKEVHDMALADAGHEESRSISLLRLSQDLWTQLTVDYIAFIAQQRGGQLAEVPFLQPKSISDSPEVRYPFHDPHWLKY
jgi:hypothetical protein